MNARFMPIVSQPPRNQPTLTRREFIRHCSAGLLGTASGSISLAASSVSEYRRGGMTYRRLGKTDLQVSLLAMGSHTKIRWTASALAPGRPG
jgi:hypothetical protein